MKIYFNFFFEFFLYRLLQLLLLQLLLQPQFQIIPLVKCQLLRNALVVPIVLRVPLHQSNSCTAAMVLSKRFTLKTSTASKALCRVSAMRSTTVQWSQTTHCSVNNKPVVKCCCIRPISPIVWRRCNSSRARTIAKNAFRTKAPKV